MQKCNIDETIEANPIPVIQYKFTAYCGSPKCFPSGMQKHVTHGQKKNIEKKTTTWCPDCGHVLYWHRHR